MISVKYHFFIYRKVNLVSKRLRKNWKSMFQQQPRFRNREAACEGEGKLKSPLFILQIELR